MATPEDIRNQQSFNEKLTDQRDLLKEITAEIGRSTATYTAAASEYRKLDNIARRLQDRQDGISNLTEKELRNLQRRAKLSLSEIKAQSDIVRKKLDGKKLSEENIKQALKRGRVNEKEAALLRGRLDGFSVEREFLETVNSELEKRVNYEEAIAAAGGDFASAIKGANKTLKSLGLSAAANFFNIQGAQEAMEKVADETYRAEGAVNQSKVRAAGLDQVLTGVAKGSILAIFTSFLKINKAGADLGRLVGKANVSFNNLNTSLATTVELLKSAAEFTRQTGLAATAIFSNDQLANIAESKKLLGLSAEQASNLALFSNQTGDSITQFEDGLVDGIKAANKLGKSAVAPGVALQDTLSASKGIALSLGNNPKLLGQAATAARALGLELSRVDSIAEGLLDFESSIQNELEAQLLTGNQINLAKARELALNNDLAGLSAELARNGASAAEFAEMNRIQQNALAQALGMSRDELANMLILQDTQGRLTDRQRQKILGVNAEQLKNLSVQQSINDSLAKMSQALAGPLAAMAQLAEYSGIVYTTIGLIGATSLAKLTYSLLTALVPLTSMSAAAITTASALTFGVAAIGIIGAIAAISSAQKKAQQTGDLAINPNGGPVVMSPREGGLYQGTKNDALMMAPPGAMGGSNAELIGRMDKLIALVEKGGDVVMDGSKVGQVITMNSYKLS